LKGERKNGGILSAKNFSFCKRGYCNILKSMKRFVILISIFLICSVYALPNINVVPETGFYYDSNPYSISGKEINFLLEKEGDFYTEPSFTLDARLMRLGRFSLKSSLNIKALIYAENRSKSYMLISPKLTLTKKAFWISLSYKYVPEYAIRPIKDADNNYEYSIPEYASNDFLLRSGLSFAKENHSKHIPVCCIRSC